MITGAILGAIVVLIAFVFSKLGKKGQENARKVGSVAGWAFWISILLALGFSAYLTLSK